MGSVLDIVDYHGLKKAAPLCCASPRHNYRIHVRESLAGIMSSFYRLGLPEAAIWNV